MQVLDIIILRIRTTQPTVCTELTVETKAKAATTVLITTICASGHYHILIKDQIPISLVIALLPRDHRHLSPPLGLLRRRAILSPILNHSSITVMPPVLTRLSQHLHPRQQTRPTEE
ncbi:hypothetical protein BGZ88_009210 [Linnemannia elongata]|nr:hypothetical protein BGZ88_009210 [Linnemannia elongata]